MILPDGKPRLRKHTASCNRKKQTTTSCLSATHAISANDEKEKPSVMSRQWELDPASRKDPFVIRLHRPNYMLPMAYNSSPNSDTILDNDRNARVTEH